MILFPYLISTLSGYLLLRILFKFYFPVHLSLHIALSIGVGLGLSGLLNFLTLLTYGKYHQYLFMLIHIATPLLLLGLNLLYKRKPVRQNEPIKTKLNIHLLFFATLIIPLYFFITFVSNTHYFGDWDAWALWNMKLKFLLHAGEDWKSIFSTIHWSTQPDYPFLLPLINMIPLIYFPSEALLITKLTSIIITLCICMIIYTSLTKTIPSMMALFAFFLLSFNSFFVYQSTSQYADSLLGLYILMSFVAISLIDTKKHPASGILLGIILGLMTFTKNEGIVMAGIISLLFLIRNIWSKNYSRKEKVKLIMLFLGALIIASSITLYFKGFLAPRNRDILVSLDKLPFFSWEGIAITFNQYKKEFLHLHWSYLWILSTFLILLGIRHIFQGECFIYTSFFILFFIVVTLIYLTTVNFDLTWRLKSTLGRIMSYMLPTVVYYSFYINYRFSSRINQHHEKI